MNNTPMSFGKRQEPPQAPIIFAATPSSIIEDAKRLIEGSRKVHHRIVKGVQPELATFGNVLLPLAHAERAMAVESKVLGFYRHVSQDPNVRDASNKAWKMFRNFETDKAMNESLFELVEAVFKKEKDLDSESRRLLGRRRKTYIRNGLNLSDGPRKRFMAIQRRLTGLISDFRKNMIDEAGGVWSSPQELDGLPNEVMMSLEKGQDSDGGILRLTFDHANYFPMMRYAETGKTRMLYFTARQNRCNQNAPLFKEIMILRHEAAQLLGYPNHAAFKIEEKMLKTPEVVNDFLDDLRSRLAAGGQVDVEKLKEMKKAHLRSQGHAYDGKLYVWDHRFYMRLMLEQQYSVDQQHIAEYFPCKRTYQGCCKFLSSYSVSPS